MENKIVWVAFLLILLASPCYAKEFDFSVSLSGIYDRGTWKSGYAENVTGKLTEDELDFSPSVQVKYTRWRLQPTFEFNYRHQGFNFSNWEQHAHVKKDSYDFLVGFTYAMKKDFSVYGLAGISHFKLKGFLAETLPNPMLYHGSFENERNLFTAKIGGHKLWDVGPIKVGPEVAVQGIFGNTGFNRCRKFRTNMVVPSLGLRIQY